MEIILQVALLIIGFVLLIKGADWLVDGASSVASNFKVSKLLIGLTIVAFGTGAPELAVSFSSLINGSTDILVGNVIGSNTYNSKYGSNNVANHNSQNKRNKFSHFLTVNRNYEYSK